MAHDSAEPCFSGKGTSDVGNHEASAAPAGPASQPEGQACSRAPEDAGSGPEGRAISVTTDGSVNGDVPVPWWYTPKRLLALYCFVWFLVYVDMGLISSNGVTGTSSDPSDPAQSGQLGGLQQSFTLSYTQLGLLPAMFMVGLMVSCVVFTELCNHVNSFRLVGLGLGMWTLGAIFTGVSQSFGFLLFARIFMGAGEASIMTLTGPFIDDVAPPASKARWFAWLSLFPSLGVAVGYLFGDLAALTSWRNLFFIEAAIAIPVVLFTLLAPPVRLRGKMAALQALEAAAGAPVAAKPSKRGCAAAARHSLSALWRELVILHRQPVFMANCYGYVPVQATLGVYTFWGPKAAKAILGSDTDTISFLLGGITVATAVVGTLGGGWLLDRMGSSLRNAMAISTVGTVVGVVFSILSFLVSPSLPVFAPLITVALLGLFFTTSPLYAVSMWSVPIPQRPAGQALQVICMHLLGDVPSPPITGAIQGRLNNWRVTMAIVTASLGISVGCYLFGTLYAPRANDFREELKVPLRDEEVAQEDSGRLGDVDDCRAS